LVGFGFFGEVVFEEPVPGSAEHQLGAKLPDRPVFIFSTPNAEMDLNRRERR
jgi:hypothetical protein